MSVGERPSKEIGKRLRIARINIDLNQAQVEKATGVDRRYLSRYELGYYAPPLDVLVKLARLYEVSTDWVLGLKTTDAPIEEPPTTRSRNWEAGMTPALETGATLNITPKEVTMLFEMLGKMKKEDDDG